MKESNDQEDMAQGYKPALTFTGMIIGYQIIGLLTFILSYSLFYLLMFDAIYFLLKKDIDLEIIKATALILTIPGIIFSAVMGLIGGMIGFSKNKNPVIGAIIGGALVTTLAFCLSWY